MKLSPVMNTEYTEAQNSFEVITMSVDLSDTVPSMLMAEEPDSRPR